MRKVLLTGDGYSDRHFAILRASGLEVTHRADAFSEDALQSMIPEFDAYVLGGTEKLTEKELSLARKLKLISFVGNGYTSFIEENAALARGIVIRNTPAVMAPAVVEVSLGLILGMQRKLFEQNRSIKESAQSAYETHELSSVCVGIVGMGAIGSRLARILRTGFGSKIIYYSRTRKAELENELGIRAVSIESLFRESDIVVLALPTTKETESLVNDRLLSLSKMGAILVNPAGARLVDPDSLKAHLESGRLAAAAFDGYFEEPLPTLAKDKFGLLSMSDSKFVVTPHTAAKTAQSWTRMVEMAIANVAEFSFGASCR